MLILTRKVGESIQIGDDIEITLTEINKGAVRIGISAPKNTPVYRKEIYEKILKENQQAAESSLGTTDLDYWNNMISQQIKTKVPNSTNE